MFFAFRPATSQEVLSPNESGSLEPPNYEDEENADSGNKIL